MRYSPMVKEMQMRAARGRGFRNNALLAGGSSAAVLAGILGISNMNNEEEEEVMI